MAAAKAPMPPGRRLRLDRRKALLDQGGLAKILGCTVEEVSLMEQNKIPLTPAAQAFCSNPPARVPPSLPPAATPLPGVPGPEEGQPEGVAAEVPLTGGPAPETGGEPPEGKKEGKKDAAPKPLGVVPAPPRQGDIRELEAALLKFFAGESFLLPREAADGTITQIEANIPGVAQFVGMLDPFDGQIIATYAPGMARAWAQLAQENPTVHRWLNAVTYGGAYRGVLAATLPAIMAIVLHHGVLGLGQPAPLEHHPQADEAA